MCFYVWAMGGSFTKVWSRNLGGRSPGHLLRSSTSAPGCGVAVRQQPRLGCLHRRLLVPTLTPLLSSLCFTSCFPISGFGRAWRLTRPSNLFVEAIFFFSEQSIPEIARVYWLAVGVVFCGSGSWLCFATRPCKQEDTCLSQD